jgi:hypothetical protein
MDQGYVLYKIVFFDEQKKLEQQLEVKELHIRTKKDGLDELGRQTRASRDGWTGGSDSNLAVTGAAYLEMRRGYAKLETLIANIAKHERGKLKIVEKIRQHGKPKMHYRFMEQYLVALQARGKAWLETDDGAAAKKDLRDKRLDRPREGRGGGEGGEGEEDTKEGGEEADHGDNA